MRRGEADQRPRRRVVGACRVQPRGRVRVDGAPAGAPRLGDGVEALSVVGTRAGEDGLRRREARRGHREGAVRREARHEGGDGGPVPPVEVGHEALEIAGDLDVHAGAQGAPHGALGVDPGREEPGQDVVLVGRDHEPLDRQAHPVRDVAGIGVAEIAGGDDEGERARRCAEGERGVDVIGRLRGDARPVDRVDGREPRFRTEGAVGERRLHQRLAIVEGADDGGVVHVGRARRRHLAALDLGDAARRVQDHHGDPVQAAERLDGRGAGVARGRGEDGGGAPAPGERRIDHARQHLEREILERQRRAVEELEQPAVGGQLDERRGGGVVEPGIALGGHRQERLAGEGVPREECRHRGGDFGIGAVAQGVEGAGVEPGPAFGQVEAAVGGEAAEQRLLERDRPAVRPARADVPQAPPPPLPRPPPAYTPPRPPGKEARRRGAVASGQWLVVSG